MGRRKVCARCHCLKPREAFGVDRSQSDMLAPQCKLCRSKMRKASYARHREKRIAAVAAYQQQQHREAILARKRQRYAESRQGGSDEHSSV
jgi:hypothetical protein